jgi:hypothetical protein
VLAILVGAVRSGISALGTPHDTLADYVRQAIASVTFGGVPPETR